MFYRRRSSSLRDKWKPSEEPSALPRLQQLALLEQQLVGFLGRNNVGGDPGDDIFSRLEHLYLKHFQRHPLGREMLQHCLQILQSTNSTPKVRLLHMFAHELSLSEESISHIQEVLKESFQSNLTLPVKDSMGFKSGLVLAQLTRKAQTVEEVTQRLIVSLEEETGWKHNSKPSRPSPSHNRKTFQQIYGGGSVHSKPRKEKPQRPNRLELGQLLYETLLTGSWRGQSQAKSHYYLHRASELKAQMLREFPGNHLDYVLRKIERQRGYTLSQFQQKLPLGLSKQEQGNKFSRTSSSLLFRKRTQTLSKDKSAASSPTKSNWPRDKENKNPSRPSTAKYYCYERPTKLSKHRVQRKSSGGMAFSTPNSPLQTANQSSCVRQENISEENSALAIPAIDFTETETKRVAPKKPLMLHFERLKMGKTAIKKKKIGKAYEWQSRAQFHQSVETEQAEVHEEVNNVHPAHKKVDSILSMSVENVLSVSVRPSQDESPPKQEMPKEKLGVLKEEMTIQMDKILQEEIELFAPNSPLRVIPMQFPRTPSQLICPEHIETLVEEASQEKLDTNRSDFSIVYSPNQYPEPCLTEKVPQSSVHALSVSEDAPKTSEEMEEKERYQYSRYNIVVLGNVSEDSIKATKLTQQEVKPEVSESEETIKLGSKPSQEEEQQPQSPSNLTQEQPKEQSEPSDQQVEKGNQPVHKENIINLQIEVKGQERKSETAGVIQIAQGSSDELQSPPLLPHVPHHIPEQGYKEEQIDQQSMFQVVNCLEKVSERVADSIVLQDSLQVSAQNWFVDRKNDKNKQVRSSKQMDITSEHSCGTINGQIQELEEPLEMKAGGSSPKLDSVHETNKTCSLEDIKLPSDSEDGIGQKKYSSQDEKQAKDQENGNELQSKNPIEEKQNLLGSQNEGKVALISDNMLPQRAPGTKKKSTFFRESEQCFPILESESNPQITSCVSHETTKAVTQKLTNEAQAAEAVGSGITQSTRSQSKEGLRMSIRIAYNQDYKSTELHKVFDHWLSPEIKADTHQICLSLSHPNSQELAASRIIPAHDLQLTKDEVFKAISDNMDELLKQFPQQDQQTYSDPQEWSKIVEKVDSLSLEPQEVELKTLKIRNLQDSEYGEPHELRFVHYIKHKKVTMELQGSKVITSPIEVSLNGDIKSIVACLHSENIFLVQDELMVGRLWAKRAERQLKVRDKVDQDARQVNFGVFERVYTIEEDRLQLEYMVKSGSDGEQMTFGGVNIDLRSKVHKNIDMIIGWALNVTNSKVSFKRGDITQFLQLL